MEKVIDSHGCPLHYEVQGTGPRILMIQGVGVHGSGWRPQIDELRDRFTCLSFDNRGIGRSRPGGATITLAQMVDDTRAVLDDVGWNDAHVVGHSLGGLIALHLALAFRQRVRSLALLCTFAHGQAAAPLTLRLAWLGLRCRIGTRRMRRRAFLGLILPTEGLHGRDPDAYAEALAGLFGHDLADQPAVAGAQRRALRACKGMPPLGALRELTTLVVSGSHDLIATPAAGQQLAKGIPGARYVEFADASHGLPITNATALNQLLIPHLEAAEAEAAEVAPNR